MKSNMNDLATHDDAAMLRTFDLITSPINQVIALAEAQAKTDALYAAEVARRLLAQNERNPASRS